MSVYRTEEEQLESIKKWWQRYGNSITIALSIAFILVAGYRYVLWHAEQVRQQASTIYERMMLEFSNQNNKAVRSYANELLKEYSGSVYADAAHLTLAKIYVAKGKLEEAQTELKPVVEKSKMLALKQIARIRRARILAAGKSFTDALHELNTVVDDAYLPIINELKGDIYGATGQYKEAINSYRLAIDAVKNKGTGNLFLEMKTNELANKSQSMLRVDKKVQST